MGSRLRCHSNPKALDLMIVQGHSFSTAKGTKLHEENQSWSASTEKRVYSRIQSD